MSFTSRPTKSGIYHIKVPGEDLYLESIPQAETSASTPWMRLNAPTSSTKQEWVDQGYHHNQRMDHLQQRGSGRTCLQKDSADISWSCFSLPKGTNRRSLLWTFTEYGGQYSKISNYDNGSDVFDSRFRDKGDDAVHFWTYSWNRSDAPLQCFVFELIGGGGADVKLDVMFIQDATGNQQPYIDAVRDTVAQICVEPKQEGGFQSEDDLSFGLIEFRDHPPQDTTFIIKSFLFTSNIATLEANLASLPAIGGGDNPEAQCDALNDALNAAWRDEAAKVVILITDSPPHGVETSGDGFPEGCPLQNDPVRAVHLMADAGITLDVIACEPTRSTYFDNALDFVAKTECRRIHPTRERGARAAAAAITGLSAKVLSRARIAALHQSAIQQAFVQKRQEADIAADLHKELATKGVRHQALKARDIYAANEAGARNARVWQYALTLEEGQALIEKVQGERIVPQYRGGGTYEVENKEPITRDDVNIIVRNVIRKAKK